MKIQDLGEFGLIERFKQLLAPLSPASQGKASNALHLGIGDDAAVWRPTPGMELVLTCDALLEGKHFLPIANASHDALIQLGARAATVNLSDLAAMAAHPRFALISLGLPPSLAVESIEAIYLGLAQTIYQAGAQIIGGNITSTYEYLLLDITLGGEVQAGQAIRRDSAQPGDKIGITGFPGLAAAGLFTLQHQLDAPTFEPLRRAYLTPTARLKEAHAIHSMLHAMTDISDGLLFDLHHLLEGSSLHATLHHDALPLHPALLHLAQSQNRKPHQLLFAPSDDYELLFCAPPQYTDAISQTLATLQTPIHWIGETHTPQPHTPRLTLRHPDGTSQPLPPTGWDHFSSPNDR